MKKNFQKILHCLILSCILIEISAQREAAALINWKESLNTASLPSWNLSNTSGSPCKWTGISCNEASSIVEIINLSNSSLGGTLNRFDFSAFPSLTSLNLSSNTLVGEIPRGIGNATKLIRLDLARNNFTNSIPIEIGNLLEFDMSLMNQIPSQLSNLQKLQLLDLGGNYLRGS
ncbi:putative Leucine-rich repeat receptor-like protein kinase family protein [Quillaja saponaria]|uniref:Leucine-rich repeat receptor-like protein kinase family protein n=1 Tax=Quillaja saponaria TaxID=32244 RepID=A0AAD7VII9_QUISA|nr:putative Leucine-rich repeat receptor-like protein kinase family protein [Quillaja saponaria]KAJ7977196.1 putative Leucine-rich repeat receptor-like protein kinase family protein [Quillaja saponaria]